MAALDWLVRPLAWSTANFCAKMFPTKKHPGQVSGFEGHRAPMRPSARRFRRVSARRCLTFGRVRAGSVPSHRGRTSVSLHDCSGLLWRGDQSLEANE